MSAIAEVQSSRAIRALCLIIAGFVLLAFSGMKESAAAGSEIDGEKAAASLLLSFGETGSAGSVLDEMSKFESELPPSFERELFSVEGTEAVYANEEETVFAFTVGGSAKEEFGSLCSQMKSGGWQMMESGIENCASFVKEGGDYRWALVGCYDVGGSTTVVVQVQGP